MCIKSHGPFTYMNCSLFELLNDDLEVKSIMGEWEILGYELGRPWGLTQPMICNLRDTSFGRDTPFH